MLNVLEACVPKWAKGETLASLGPASPQYWHFLVEAKKLAYADLYSYNADPDVVKVPLDMLLSKAHAAIALRQGRSRPRLLDRPGLNRDRGRRHHRAFDRR